MLTYSLLSLLLSLLCCRSAGNHTGRIKVVFTPTICKVTCTGGRCQNTCEKGNTTTIISENGRATDTLTAPNFRVVLCQYVDMYHLQKFSDDFVVVRCVRDGQDGEYRDLVLVRNHLLLSVTKTKEMVVDVKRKRSTVRPHYHHGVTAGLRIVHQPEPSSQQRPVGSVLWAVSCGQRPVGSVLWAASCGQRPMGSVLWASSCGQRPMGIVLWAASCGQRPMSSVLWASSCGQRPLGIVLWAASCGQCPVTTYKGLEDDQHCTVQQQMSYLVCHLPCMNGGKCSARDKCQCPPNFTGKFCQMPAQNGHRGQQTVLSSQGGQVHSTHTLPLTFSSGQNQGLVNIHVKHPPEASVQIHQVSQVDSSSSGHSKTSQSGHSYTYHMSESSSSSSSSSSSGQKIQHHSHSVVYPNQQTFPQYQPVTSKSQLGRCFQETTGTQCGKALPGLSKQEDCCGTIGTSWGFHKCQKCPRKQSIPLLECPQGYRFNGTRCIDVNECQLQAVCPNGNCINTVGSYRCMCKPGFIPDATLTACYQTPTQSLSSAYLPEKIQRCAVTDWDPSTVFIIAEAPPVREERGACFRLVGAGAQCLHPVSTQLSKQLCCCSVGKAWGPHCDRCPLPGTAAFKEICPGGMGYHVTTPYVYKPKPPPANPWNHPDSHGPAKPTIKHQEPMPVLPMPFPTLQQPVEAFSFTERQLPVVPGKHGTVQMNQQKCAHDLTLMHMRGLMPFVLFSVWFSSVALRRAVATAAPEQELSSSPGIDKSVVEQHQLSPGVSTITMEPARPELVEKTSPKAPVKILPHSASQDMSPIQLAEVDECLISPDICGQGICYNTAESYTCICNEGYRQDDEGSTCIDVDECAVSPPLCANGRCKNTPGSFLCLCDRGFIPDEEGTSCNDIDECEVPRICPENSDCMNTLGSYDCHCTSGYRLGQSGQCEDVDECQNGNVCPSGLCYNTLGSYMCSPCPEGFQGKDGQCVDIDECLDATACANGQCSNHEGYYVCTCNEGFALVPDGKACTDIDECQDESVCTRGHCQNTEGSFICTCETGFRLAPSGEQCDDVDECQEWSELCDAVGQCVNNMGSYHCNCPPGYRQVSGTHCQDVDECMEESLPRLHGGECVNTEGSFHFICEPGYVWTQDPPGCEDVDECMEESFLPLHGGQCVNTEGSFHFICEPGYVWTQDPPDCEDIDECSNGAKCLNGTCLNTEGSFQCQCDRGFRLETATHTCQDIDECAEFGQSICGAWQCKNTPGSYRCVVPCPAGHTRNTHGACVGESTRPPHSIISFRHAVSIFLLCMLKTQGDLSLSFSLDVDECALNRSLCREHGVCHNTVGSFMCHCDPGYQDTDGQGCVDLNECEVLVDVCGEAACENVPGSFMCVCQEGFEYNRISAKCLPAPKASSVERKECYYNLNDENLCDNVLTSNLTIEECCCTLGAGWGDNCEVFPCPVQGTDQFAQMCPAGHGSVPTGDTGVSFANSYKGVDYGKPQTLAHKIMDGVQPLKPATPQNASCRIAVLRYSYSQPLSQTYQAEAEAGFDSIQTGSSLHTQALCTYMCGRYIVESLYYDHFILSTAVACKGESLGPLVRVEDTDECLDESNCIDGQCFNNHGSYQCFCPPPMVLAPDNKHCILPDVADQREQSVFLSICWLHVTETMTCSNALDNQRTTYTECCCLHGQAWGMECALCPPRDTDDYAYMCNIQGSSTSRRPYGRDALVAGPTHEYDYEQRPLDPDPTLYEDYETTNTGRYEAFEGLRAEECGILNGCENGRCVRVQEGYTCDCFDGYTLDMSRMACVDVNECSELNKRMSLCKNAKCINTPGSYKCQCLPGYTQSDQPNYCVPSQQSAAPAARTATE
ncbi:hypothetical protein NFI96_031938 [Prochilodus magdalenae]|nr:hypothetical protein NFI96_031938 [Prochilodus magdalenae]